MSDLDEEVFISCMTECIEAVESANSDIIELENNPDNPDLIDKIFRAAHSVKGTLGFFNFINLVAYTHAGENLLNSIRNKNTDPTPKVITGLLLFFDSLHDYLKYVLENKSEPNDNLTKDIAALSGLIDSNADPEDEPIQAEVASVESDKIESNSNEKEKPDSKDSQTKDDTKEKQKSNSQDIKKSKEKNTIRVDVKLLDKMMDMVGELVLSRNQVLQIVDEHDITILNSACGHLNYVTRELQENIMETRMQPISQVWNKFPRIIRDFCLTSGKKINITMSGEETELDKSLIEAIKDPLTHIVRNSIDHGIEIPSDRVNKDKPESGTFSLNAYHESGQVVIEISDDGKGINPEKMKSSAVEKGVITEETAAKLTDFEAMNLIFRAGFSTADSVTDISGRGVGMDVVRTNVENIKGVIELSSEVDKGTTFRIKIPLTLAIMPGLIVKAAESRFIIPQTNLVEMIRHNDIAPNDVFETVHDIQVYRLRNELLKVVYLTDVLGLSKEEERDKNIAATFNSIVIKANGQKFCLVVDSIEDSQEIVVKPLIHQLRNMSLYAGLNIMSDGAVVIILEVSGIANYLGLFDSKPSPKLDTDSSNTSSDISNNTKEVLLVESNRNEQYGIPIKGLKRIEKTPKNKIEKTGNQLQLQYNNTIIPIWDIASIISGDRFEDLCSNSPYVYIIVFSHNGAFVGYMVDQVEDIKQVDYEELNPSTRNYVLGTTVLEKRITEIIDIDSLYEKTSNLRERDVS